MAGLSRIPSFVRRAAALAGLLALGACSSLSLPKLPTLNMGDSFLGLITPYRIDIVQGNVVTREQAALVKPGMSRAQVRDLLGSPMLTDVFHADRWDYVFTIKRPGTEPQQRSIVAWFDGDRLNKLDAPELPSEREFVAAISRIRTSGQPPVLELSAEQKQALPKPAKAPVETPVPTGALRSYPPLEPS